MPTSRREFVALSSMGLLAAALPAQTPGVANAKSYARGAARFRHCARSRPRGVCRHIRQAEKLVQVEMTQAELDEAAEELAHADGASLRTPGRARARWSSKTALLPRRNGILRCRGLRRIPVSRIVSFAAPTRSSLAGRTKRTSPTLGCAAFPMDRAAPAHVGAPRRRSTSAASTLRSKAAMRDHP